MSKPEGANPPAPQGPDAKFYGWRMVGVALLADFIAVGFFFYSFGVFLKDIDADLAGSRFGVSLGIAVTNLVSGLFAPFIGRALDRFPIKRVMLTGAAAVSAGFAALSQIETVWQYYLVLGSFFAFGLGMMGGLASSKLVANWFQVRRGTALGIANTGISLSGVVMPLLATWLVTEFGWRGGFRVYSLATLAIVVPVVAIFVVSRPEDMGLRPDGAAPEAGSDGLASSDVFWSTRQILGSRNFWVIALPFAMIFSSLSAILFHLVPYADDMGIPSYRAAWVLSLAAGGGVLGKLVFGRLVDRFDPRLVVWASFATQMAGLLVILREPGYAGLVAGALIFGFGMGGVVPLQSAVSGMAFGRLCFGKVMGLMRPVQVPIHAIGIPLAAWIYDTTGSYGLAWWIFLGVYIAGSLIIAGLRVGGIHDPAFGSDGEARLV